MKRLLPVTFLLLFSSQLLAAPLTAKSTGYDWRKASRQEKISLIEDALRRLNANYPASGMMACLNTAFADPVQPYIHGQPLSDSMAFCHIQIKSAY